MITVDFSKIDFYQVIRENYQDERMQKVLDSLPEMERKILDYRVGIGQEKLSRPAIAKIMGVTQEVVRNAELRALKRLKHPARIQMINAILDPNFQISEKVQEYYQNQNKKM